MKSLPIANCRLPIGFIVIATEVCGIIANRCIQTNRQLAIGNRQYPYVAA
jgi:hypothetical protein